MDKIIEFINKEHNNIFADFKISNVVFDKALNKVTLLFSYRVERKEITDVERTKLYEACKKYIGMDTDIELKTRKAIVDNDVLSILIMKYLEKNYYSVYSNFDKSNIYFSSTDNEVKIGLKLVKAYYEFFKNKDFQDELKSYLQRFYFDDFIIELVEKEAEDFNNILEDRIEKITASELDARRVKITKYDILPKKEIVGEMISDKATLIEGLTKPSTGEVVAGTLKFLNKRSFLSKRKNENGEAIEKEYFSFSVVDESGTMQCVIFPRSEELEKFEELEGEWVAVFGDIENFNDKLNFKAKKLSLIEKVELNLEESIVYKSENNNYLYVKPEPYIMMEQSNLFDTTSQEANEFLSNNDVVVFDFETTGLESTKNEIIEIGAVKICKGKITETFSCLVKPNGIISQEITNITGITNEMVADSYSINEVLQDFYKFTRSSVLSAYNIAFDYGFLYFAGKKQGYKFDNRQIDTMYLAKLKLKGLKNYKLKTVATALEVSLENAHRAVFDAVATAEVFIKLSDDLK